VVAVGDDAADTRTATVQVGERLTGVFEVARMLRLPEFRDHLKSVGHSSGDAIIVISAAKHLMGAHGLAEALAAVAKPSARFGYVFVRLVLAGPDAST
jgi:hypothetical protein